LVDRFPKLIYAAMKTTGQIAAMKGMAWESPRGLVSIDPETRKKCGTIYRSS
jgi:branched-chain amino acid transport system substrate-binding protein